MFKKLLLGLFIVVNAFSAANVTTIPGATAIQFYFRNYTYANLALDLPILSMGLATDLNKLVYRNSIGNMYKIMVDASGSSNTPQNRVFYADVNGSATASTNFTFNGTDLYINSSNTSTINTGRVTGTDFEASDTVSGKQLIVDSLKLGTGSFLKIYAEGSFPCTLKTTDVTEQDIGTAYYTKIGNVLTIIFPILSGMSNSTTLRIYCSLPFVPKNNLAAGGVKGYNGSVSTSLIYEWTSGTPTYIEFKKYDNSTFNTSGIKGIGQCPITYITE